MLICSLLTQVEYIKTHSSLPSPSRLCPPRRLRSPCHLRSPCRLRPSAPSPTHHHHHPYRVLPRAMSRHHHLACKHLGRVYVTTPAPTPPAACKCMWGVCDIALPLRRHVSPTLLPANTWQGVFVVLGKFGLCLKLISEIGGLEWSVCSETLEPPCPMTRDGGSKISEQTDHSKPPISLISFRHKPNFPNTRPHLQQHPAATSPRHPLTRKRVGRGNSTMLATPCRPQMHVGGVGNNAPAATSAPTPSPACKQHWPSHHPQHPLSLPNAWVVYVPTSPPAHKHIVGGVCDNVRLAATPPAHNCVVGVVQRNPDTSRSQTHGGGCMRTAATPPY
jgi:hypothetical protein